MAENLRREIDSGSFSHGREEGGSGVGSTTDMKSGVDVGMGNELLMAHAEATRLCRLSVEWEKTLTTIRKLPKFEDFLRSLRFSVLQSVCLGSEIAGEVGAGCQQNNRHPLCYGKQHQCAHLGRQGCQTPPIVGTTFAGGIWTGKADAVHVCWGLHP